MIIPYRVIYTIMNESCKDQVPLVAPDAFPGRPHIAASRN
jgi:hypothetical protein